MLKILQNIININNPWFIPTIILILTLIIEHIIPKIIARIRSLFGSYTGYYLLLTGLSKKGQYIIEIAKGYHHGKSFNGKIKHIGFVDFINNDIIEANKYLNWYHFKGKVSNDILLIHYFPIKKRNRNCGSLTLNINSIGNFFFGIWSGKESGKIKSSHCIWIKIKKNLLKEKSFPTIVDFTKKYINLDENNHINENLKDIVTADSYLEETNKKPIIKYKSAGVHIIIGTKGGIGKTACALKISLNQFLNQSNQKTIIGVNNINSLLNNYTRKFAFEEFDHLLKKRDETALISKKYIEEILTLLEMDKSKKEYKLIDLTKNEAMLKRNIFKNIGKKILRYLKISSKRNKKK